MVFRSVDTSKNLQKDGFRGQDLDFGGKCVYDRRILRTQVIHIRLIGKLDPVLCLPHSVAMAGDCL